MEFWRQLPFSPLLRSSQHQSSVGNVPSGMSQQQESTSFRRHMGLTRMLFEFTDLSMLLLGSFLYNEPAHYV